MTVQHKNLAAGKWHTLSLIEQLGNVGGEVSRAMHWQNKDKRLFTGAIDRALELLDFTIQDPRWRNRLKELVRVREMLVDAVFGGQEYKSSLEALNRYFFYFALAAGVNK